MTVIDPLQVVVKLSKKRPEVFPRGERVDGVDGVVPRIGASDHLLRPGGAAPVRDDEGLPRQRRARRSRAAAPTSCAASSSSRASISASRPPPSPAGAGTSARRSRKVGGRSRHPQAPRGDSGNGCHSGRVSQIGEVGARHPMSSLGTEHPDPGVHRGGEGDGLPRHRDRRQGGGGDGAPGRRGEFAATSTAARTATGSRARRKCRDRHPRRREVARLEHRPASTRSLSRGADKSSRSAAPGSKGSRGRPAYRRRQGDDRLRHPARAAQPSHTGKMRTIQPRPCRMR